MNSEPLYEVYVDVVYGNCAVMDYLLLTFTGLLLRRSATRLRRILISMLCAGITCVSLFMPGLPAAVRNICGGGVSGILAVVLTYRLKAGEGLLNGVLCMYLLTFLYGGLLSFLNDSIPFLRHNGLTVPLILLAACALYAVLSRLWHALAAARENHSRLYRVDFSRNGNHYVCTGLFDTGNSLYEPIRKLPVCILEAEIFPESEREKAEAVIPYHSLGRENGMLYGVFLEQVTFTPLKTKDIHTEISVSETAGEGDGKIVCQRVLAGLYRGRLDHRGSYRMILHPALFEQKPV